MCSISNDNKSPLITLREVFGHQNFRQGQLEVILSVLSGKDTFTLFATGVGKSVCFQLPALHTEKLVIVVSPLISLIEDQVKNLNLKFKREIAVSFAASNVTQNGLEKIQSGESLIIYVTPEIFANEFFLEQCKQIHHNVRPIVLLAVDEAHFIASQGFDFRTSFREIANFRDILPNIPIMALTATATPHIRENLIAALKMKSPAVFTGSYDKPNLAFTIHSENKKKAIASIVQQCTQTAFDGSWVVFTYTKKDANMIHKCIIENAKTEQSKNASLYHGDILYNDRMQIQKDFDAGTTRLVVATGSSFGTGVDKNDIRHVILFTIPKNFEVCPRHAFHCSNRGLVMLLLGGQEFYQLAGRCGRDGKPSQVTAYIGNGDHYMHLAKKKACSAEHKKMQKQERESLFSLVNFCRNVKTCRRALILRYFGQAIPGFECMMCDNCKRKL